MKITDRLLVVERELRDNRTSHLNSIADLTRLMLEIHKGKLSMESIAFIERMNINPKQFTKEDNFFELK